ncbi:hypothetical protein D910_00362 [Dendroctonus ponderosae]|uniref:Tc1-like transposase DDE domain-containing protein n=1 Tax=Dendroctonus ponderosae TaxID=77166 RepID=U4UTF6_DENPD|nr:hypothetical protein D910_00362 [Dendroctonus ponderosae]
MDVPVATLQNLYFQQDGAPPHNGRIITEFLNHDFPNKWIGNLGPVRWPARSPDITPLDFFAWGFLENVVYCRLYETEEELRHAVIEAANRITPEIIRKSCEAVMRRCMMCVRENVFDV